MYGELLDELVGWEAAALDAEYRRIELAERALQARKLAVLHAVEANQVAVVDGHRSTRGYQKAATNTSGPRANAELRRARACRDHHQLGDALQAGHIGVAQVDELARALAHPRAGDRFANVLDAFVEHAEHFPHRDLVLLIDRWLTLADTDGSWHDVVDDVQGRDAHVTVLGGTLDVTVTGGDTVTAERLVAVFDRFAEAEFQADLAARNEQHGDDAAAAALPRTVKQRRYDAFVKMVAAANAAADAGLVGKLPKVVVNLLFDQASATHFLERSGVALPDGQVFDAAELDDVELDQLLSDLTVEPDRLLDVRCETQSGHVVHPALLLRALLTEHVRRVVLGADGTRIDFARDARTFRGSARQAAFLLHHRCEHPGCDTPATWSQVDHNHEWSHEGRTNQHNATVQDGFHNRFKHQAGWRGYKATNRRTYWKRRDGTLVLPAGERPPDLTSAELDEVIDRRIAALRPSPHAA